MDASAAERELAGIAEQVARGSPRPNPLFRIVLRRPRRRFDLDRQARTAGVDHEIHLLADGGSPIHDLGVFQPPVAPRQRITEHQLSIWASAVGGPLQPREMQRQTA